jgi:hypothetical protein
MWSGAAAPDMDNTSWARGWRAKAGGPTGTPGAARGARRVNQTVAGSA